MIHRRIVHVVGMVFAWKTSEAVDRCRLMEEVYVETRQGLTAYIAWLTDSEISWHRIRSLSISWFSIYIWFADLPYGYRAVKLSQLMCSRLVPWTDLLRRHRLRFSRRLATIGWGGWRAGSVCECQVAIQILDFLASNSYPSHTHFIHNSYHS